jgi:1-acyl-sn-glycerol-3-phosphate acyltransferase
LLQLLNRFRSFWRLSRLALHLGYGIAIAVLVLPHLQGSRRQRVIGTWSAHVLHILKVRLIVTGMLPTVDERAMLFVANHVSWLDIWAINAVRTVRFIAKAELRAWPVIGWLSQQAGTIFIRRARRHDTSRVSVAGAEALRGGDCVCVFPEGTTTDGTCIYPFKSSLLQSAVEAQAPVWPVALRYVRDDGSANTAVAYAGDTTMKQSLWSILGQHEIFAHLTFAQPIQPEGRNRRQLAQAAEEVISSLARLPVRAAPGTASDLPDAAR